MSNAHIAQILMYWTRRSSWARKHGSLSNGN